MPAMDDDLKRELAEKMGVPVEDVERELAQRWAAASPELREEVTRSMEVAAEAVALTAVELSNSKLADTLRGHARELRGMAADLDDE